MEKENRDIPKIPETFKGKTGKGCGYTKTQPRQWTQDEITWLKKLVKQGYSKKEIAISLGRTETSIRIKLKRISKTENNYNNKHIEEKYKLNELFLEEIKPATILDLYCGTNNFYKKYKATTNDINKNIKSDYNEDALKLLCRLYYENKKYDMIDLDPFGSAYDCFDLAIKMAKKGLIITLGELGHKRWKRLDFVKTHYNIQNIEDFNIEKIISYIQTIGLRNKKRLIVWKYKQWENTGRVYFKIEKAKIIEQWGE